MRFLETVTFVGNDALVPIDRIKFVHFVYNDGYRIKVISDDGEWEECFQEDEKKALVRYEIIKGIIGAR